MHIALALLFLQAQPVLMRVAVTVPVDPPTALVAQTSIVRRFLILSGRTVSLKWKGSPDLTNPAKAKTGYRVYRALLGGQFSSITSGLVTTPSYADRTAQRKKTYQYRVTAVIGAVESKPSNTATVTVK
jgi:hypothetical protein